MKDRINKCPKDLRVKLENQKVKWMGIRKKDNLTNSSDSRINSKKEERLKFRKNRHTYNN